MNWAPDTSESGISCEPLNYKKLIGNSIECLSHNGRCQIDVLVGCPLFKNVSLLGGLIHFAVRGGSAYGLDTRTDRS